VVVSLPCTNSGSTTKRIKESDLIVTQLGNTFDDDFPFFKMYFSKSEKQHYLN